MTEFVSYEVQKGANTVLDIVGNKGLPYTKLFS